MAIKLVCLCYPNPHNWPNLILKIKLNDGYTQHVLTNRNGFAKFPDSPVMSSNIKVEVTVSGPAFQIKPLKLKAITNKSLLSNNQSPMDVLHDDRRQLMAELKDNDSSTTGILRRINPDCDDDIVYPFTEQKSMPQISSLPPQIDSNLETRFVATQNSNLISDLTSSPASNSASEFSSEKMTLIDVAVRKPYSKMDQYAKTKRQMDQYATSNFECILPGCAPNLAKEEDSAISKSERLDYKHMDTSNDIYPPRYATFSLDPIYSSGGLLCVPLREELDATASQLFSVASVYLNRFQQLESQNTLHELAIKKIVSNLKRVLKQIINLNCGYVILFVRSSPDSLVPLPLPNHNLTPNSLLREALPYSYMCINLPDIIVCKNCASTLKTGPNNESNQLRLPRLHSSVVSFGPLSFPKLRPSPPDKTMRSQTPSRSSQLLYSVILMPDEQTPANRRLCQTMRSSPVMSKSYSSELNACANKTVSLGDLVASIYKKDLPPILPQQTILHPTKPTFTHHKPLTTWIPSPQRGAKHGHVYWTPKIAIKCNRCYRTAYTPSLAQFWKDICSWEAASTILRLKPLNVEQFEALLHVTRGSSEQQLAMFRYIMTCETSENDSTESIGVSQMMEILKDVYEKHDILKDKRLLMDFVSLTSVAGLEKFMIGKLYPVIGRNPETYSFFLVQQLAHSRNDSSLAWLADYIYKTVIDALRSSNLKYLTDLFWLLKSAAISTGLKTTAAKKVLHRIIYKAGEDRNGSKYLEIIYKQMLFKRFLTGLTAELAQNRHENAEKRTERLRKLLCQATASDESLTLDNSFCSPVRADLDDPVLPEESILNDFLGNLSEEIISGPCLSPEELAMKREPPGVIYTIDSRVLLGNIDERNDKPEKFRASQKSGLDRSSFSFMGLFNKVEEEEATINTVVDRHEQEILELLKNSLKSTGIIPPSEKGILKCSFPLPTDPSLRFLGIDEGESLVARSSKYPLILSCRVRNEDGLVSQRKILFKTEDDLRQDQLFIEISKWLDICIYQKLFGLKTDLYRYRVLPMSCHEGMVEFVEDAIPISELKRTGNLLKGMLSSDEVEVRVCAGETGGLVLQNSFVRSCAAYSVLTYVCAVGDRHQDNLMVDKNGRFFHIDFGYILGSDPKPFPTAPMKITKEMVESLGGLNSSTFESFCITCAQLFYILRRCHRQFSTLVALTYASDIPDIKRLRQTIMSQRPRASVIWSFKDHIVQRLHTNLDDAEAVNFLINEVVHVSVKSMFPMLIDKLHEWAIYWK